MEGTSPRGRSRTLPVLIALAAVVGALAVFTAGFAVGRVTLARPIIVTVPASSSNDNPLAVGTFLAARRGAQDRAAQSDLRMAAVTAMAFYTDHATYLVEDPATTAAAYGVDEPSLRFAPTATDYTVGVYEPSDVQVVLVKQSESGEWFCVVSRPDDDTVFGRAGMLAEVNTATACESARRWD